MIFERDILDDLLRWKNSPNRKPALIKGARQIGKSWVMREFGRRNFEYTAVFNFDNDPDLHPIFDKTKDVKRLIADLSLHTNVPIDPEKTLIVFDEIQMCESALNSLKYFCEDAPEFHVVSAGSLLGVAVRHRRMSVPVGKVNIIKLYPLTFREFLRASSPDTFNYLESLEAVGNLPEIIFHKLEEEYRRYMVSGGMPDVASSLLDLQGMDVVESKLEDILGLYELDFSKYASPLDVVRINNIWKSLPSQLAKENRKFVYKVVKTGARAREYEDSILWLEEAGLIYRIYDLQKPGLPLSAYRDIQGFKVYAFDCGLLRRLSNLSPEVVLSKHIGFVEFKGALAENMVLQSLVKQLGTAPYYWTSDNSAEVDFVIENVSDIIPIEVKSDTRISGKSLSVYNEKFSPKYRIRFSANNLKFNDGLVSIPIFMTDWTMKILTMLG